MDGNLRGVSFFKSPIRYNKDFHGDAIHGFGAR